MIKLISNNKVLVFSLFSLLIALLLATNSSQYHSGFVLGNENTNSIVETNWGFVCMSVIFTVAGLAGIGYWLLESKNKQ